MDRVTLLTSYRFLYGSIENQVKNYATGFVLEVIPFGKGKIAVCSNLNSFKAFYLKNGLLGWRIKCESDTILGGNEYLSLEGLPLLPDKNQFLIWGIVSLSVKTVKYKGIEVPINFPFHDTPCFT